MNRHAFTLMELMVTTIVVGVLASVAVPSYSRHMERVRVTEGVHALTVLREDQLAYNTEHGSFATSLTQLDIDIPASGNWNVPVVFNNPGHLAEITNRTDGYTLWSEQVDGNINCVVTTGRASICSDVGYTPF